MFLSISYRIFRNLDVAGYNYIWWKYESDHAAYPDRVIYGSESYPKEAAQNWNLVEKHPYVIGILSGRLSTIWVKPDWLMPCTWVRANTIRNSWVGPGIMAGVATSTFAVTRSPNLIIVMCFGGNVR